MVKARLLPRRHEFRSLSVQRLLPLQTSDSGGGCRRIHQVGKRNGGGRRVPNRDSQNQHSASVSLKQHHWRLEVSYLQQLSGDGSCSTAPGQEEANRFKARGAFATGM